jgi:hypothetical protein
MRSRLPLLAVAGLVLAGFGATSLPGVPAWSQAGRAQAAPAKAAPAQAAPCPWVGSAAPVPARVDEVLAQMTLAEKLSMIHGSSASDGYAGYVPAIPRLCVPALKLEDNAVRGRRRVRPADRPRLRRRHREVTGRAPRDSGRTPGWAGDSASSSAAVMVRKPG